MFEGWTFLFLASTEAWWNWNPCSKLQLYCPSEPNKGFWWGVFGIKTGWQAQSKQSKQSPWSKENLRVLQLHQRKLVLLFSILTQFLLPPHTARKCRLPTPTSRIPECRSLFFRMSSKNIHVCRQFQAKSLGLWLCSFSLNKVILFWTKC